MFCIGRKLPVLIFLLTWATLQGQHKYQEKEVQHWSPFFINVVSVGINGELPTVKTEPQNVHFNTTRLDLITFNFNHFNIGMATLFNIVDVRLDSLTRQPLPHSKNVFKNLFNFDLGYWVPMGVNIPIFTNKEHLFALNANGYFFPFDPGDQIEENDPLAQFKGSFTYPRLIEVGLYYSTYGFSVSGGYRYQWGKYRWEPPKDLSTTSRPVVVGDLNAWFLTVSVGFMWPNHNVKLITKRIETDKPSLKFQTALSKHQTILSAGSQIYLPITLRNEGKGLAENLTLTVESNSDYLSFPETMELGNINPRNEIHFQLPLKVHSDVPKPIETNLILVCKEKDGFTARKTLTFELRPSAMEVDSRIPKSKNRNENSYAIIIGIENYSPHKNLPPAIAAKHDAEIFRKYAVRILGVPDNIGHVKLLTNSQATSAELRSIFDPHNGWLAQRVNTSSIVYVYFAGHGISTPMDQSVYLLPFDVSPNQNLSEYALSIEELQSSLAQLDIDKAFIFLDACFSGRSRGDVTLTKGRAISVNYPEGLAYDNIITFASSQGTEISNLYAAKNHGLFTYFLLRGLRGEADFAPEDSRITIGELESYLYERVKQKAFEMDTYQTPTLLSGNRDEIIVQF